ncbi:MAG: hormogonium polysaccharide biosynthesis protein HpsA [Nostoc sp. ChiQUE02]|uniref:hormogonium polysaccharide biosynthesis protein HpsA n=1 Tax=Nostoc sp. ChiQUE02 TaxID=3075377 RepID=UPI002AD2E422|nr:hormogonium polysaccharide biosynthesis protein HpsA [Nostoc sp. ChiQUE02]MDZ8235360.1 hormogonium polysaccharide biosynthesis protein HpsA [Nostoc sp. ChiQUE02]
MSRKRQLVKAIQKTFKQISKQFLSAINKQIIWLLRACFGTRRRRGSENAGFLLPTVAMVLIVVVLLTTAILFRSFERSKNASNVRVNEAVLNAATPALDRARAKLDKLFDDRRLPRATPSDTALEGIFKTKIYLDEYTFGDETQLNLNYTGQTALPTGWMFPIDTNNNGKFDTYTLYGIYFRNPPISGGTYSRTRNPLEARTPPMTSGSISNGCEDTLGTSATLVGSTGWFNIAGKLKKSFFVYTANVPITNPPTTGSDANKYEAFTGNKGFSGLEYQQDRVQLPLVNNAVVYEDDIELTPGPTFNLNGRILTNSNFLTGSGFQFVTLYQVSSKDSCFYDDDNAKIIVGGNLAAGPFTGNDDLGNSTGVHLFQGKGVNPNTASGVKDNKSVNRTPNEIAYNSLAYVQRINLLVQAQTPNNATDPQEVKDGITQQLKVLNLTTSTASTEQQATIRNNQLGLYFKKRTRRVPYYEVPFGINGVGTYTTSTVLEGSGESLRPPDTWVYPFDPSDGKTETNYAKLRLKPNASDNTKLLPSATEPTKQQQVGKEQYVGDRILLGNNLPALWWNGTTFIGSDSTDTQNITGINWDDPSTVNRNRRSRVQQLADLGTVERDGDWESAASKVPTTPQDPVGGLRVVTGAGIYLPSNLIVSSPPADFTAATTKIWSDMMPVPSETATVGTSVDARDIAGNFDYSTIQVSNQPYLRMRATAVYHYQASGYNPLTPAPIACISSYYDPTNSTTAKNLNSLPSATGFIYDKATDGRSHNGIVYAAPTKTVSDYSDLLNYQASLRYPNGRLVNEVLSKALPKAAASRTLSEQSAIDTAICAIQILDGTIGSPDNSVIPHGAIYETAFLDARQIKAIHRDVDAAGTSTPGVQTFTNADGDGSGNFANPNTQYELAKETRQPLEIRTTVLDYNALRLKTYGSETPQEYLIPNSGIIYATRDDALLDLSASSTNGKDIQKSNSPVDFKLDPTRRPNAIMLRNGDPTGNPNGSIWRVQAYRDAEKGLILASNLPVYIKGDFNKHTQEEFTTALTSDLSNFYSRTAATRNKNFACRTGDARLPNCTTGDAWRPASVLSDAITLLSNNFELGYRNDGDYDLNNNLGDANSINVLKQNGFDTNNANVINAGWYDTSTGYPSSTSTKSSYLNNFVTPIQRRKYTTTATVPEYLMEYCPKLPVSACTDPVNDWVIAPGVKASSAIGLSFSLTTYKAGTSAQLPADSNYQRYPRRLAFKRDTTTGEVLLNNSKPIILGIKSGVIKDFPIDSFTSNADTRPDPKNNGLWFRTTSPNDDTQQLKFTLGSGASYQPILSPVLQIQAAFDDENASPVSTSRIGPSNTQDSYWIQWATSTTFNLAAAGGDTPARPTEDNGGLHNFVRFLENWNPTGDLNAAVAAIVNGSFIQRTRSVYATAPFVAFLNNSPTITSNPPTVYPIANAGGQVPFYQAPKRQWGYDVALLSQSPDAFSQKLAITPDDKPNEYFREVGRDDAWVQTLLCAKDTKGTVSTSDDTDAVDQAQRPTNCPS